MAVPMRVAMRVAIFMVIVIVIMSVAGHARIIPMTTFSAAIRLFFCDGTTGMNNLN